MNEEAIVSTNEMTAGEMLKNARTTGRRKREIATISKLLCIREEFLTALEEGNYRVIPEDVYILGFARSYAVELGLNPEEVILKLKKELGIVKKESKEDTESKAKQKAEAPKAKTKIDKETVLKIGKDSIRFVKKNWVWFVAGLVAVVLVVLTIVGIVVYKKESAKKAAAAAAAIEESVAMPEPDFRYPIHEKFDVKNSKEARVILQAEKESWVKIEDARGSSVFSRVLIAGDVYYLPAGDKFKATFGNVGAIDVWVDGRLIKKLGPANTKKTGISMSPDALKSVGYAE